MSDMSMKSIFRKVQAVGFMVGFFACAALVASAHATKAAWPESQCPAFSQRDASGTCQRSVHQEPNYTCPVNMSLHRQNKRCYRSESKPLGFRSKRGLSFLRRFLRRFLVLVVERLQVTT